MSPEERARARAIGAAQAAELPPLPEDVAREAAQILVAARRRRREAEAAKQAAS